MASNMPTRSPTKVKPTCQRLNSYTPLNTTSKAPKNRYRIPSNIEENKHRFRHIGSKKSSMNGRYSEWTTVIVIDRSDISIGALNLSSPVSFLSFLALVRKITG